MDLKKSTTAIRAVAIVVFVTGVCVTLAYAQDPPVADTARVAATLPACVVKRGRDITVAKHVLDAMGFPTAPDAARQWVVKHAVTGLAYGAVQVSGQADMLLSRIEEEVITVYRVHPDMAYVRAARFAKREALPLPEIDPKEGYERMMTDWGVVLGPTPESC